MPWAEAVTEPDDLRRCVRDVVALSTLPAVWTNYGPGQIVDSVAAALLAMLGADFVYAALPPRRSEPSIEAVHVDKKWTIPPGGETKIRTALHDAWLGRSEQTGVIANPLGRGGINIVSVPIGFHGDAVVVAGSRRSNFPTNTQRLLLGIAANAMTVALQRWNAEADLRYLAQALEHRVAERTAELEEANDRLRTQMIERERADVRLQKLQLELFHAARLSTAGQMAAALAHEINQPLTAIANSVHAVQRLLAKNPRGKLDTVHAVLDEASEQALRGARIIRRLRDFVTLGETEQRIERLPVLIEEATSLALPSSLTPSVQVSLRFDPKTLQVIADRIQIQQVLVNLIRNAAEAMAETTQRELAVTTTLVDGETVQVTVADRGPGLPNEMARRLFQPFVSTKRHGMGLGLVICRSIVEAHGGRLWSEPNPGGGTIFGFTLASAAAVGETNVD
jgi:signal transduction histidine kinase